LTPLLSGLEAQAAFWQIVYPLIQTTVFYYSRQAVRTIGFGLKSPWDIYSRLPIPEPIGVLRPKQIQDSINDRFITQEAESLVAHRLLMP
jgi:hypothetical protein